MYDTIGNPEDLDSDASDSDDSKKIANNSLPCLVLEWMDCTLKEVSSERYRQNCVFLVAILKAVLSSLVTLREEKLVHTDIKPDNILISGLDTGHPIVKIGDLGLTRRDGFRGPAQSFAMRAPEVYRGLGCFHCSEVWALAATLFCWIKPGVFGVTGNLYDLPNESWGIAKLMLLFPGWTGSPVNNECIESEFKLSNLLTVEPDPEKGDEKVVNVSSLENEMQTMDIPQVLRDLLRSLLVVYPNIRPSAANALTSKEFLALQKEAYASA